ncbi:MAG: translation initiation factor IF-2 [Pseudomonadota bacterium]
MAETTVKQLADTVGTPVERLLDQLRDAGVEKQGASDAISAEEKSKLLVHLQKSRGGEAGASKRITLKRKSVNTLKVGGGGAKKTVNVEVRGKRTYVKRTADADPAVEADNADRALSIREQRERDERELAELDRKRLAAEEAKREEEAARRRAREDARTPAEEAVAADADASATAASDAEAKAAPAPAPAQPAQPAVSIADVEAAALADSSGNKKAVAAKTGDRNRGPDKRGRRDGGSDRGSSRRKPGVSVRDRGGRNRPRRGALRTADMETRHGFEKPVAPVVRDVIVPETITVANLADRMSIKAAQVIRTLMGMGVMATINQVLDHDTALLIVEEMGHKAVSQSDESIEQEITAKLVGELGAEEARPPVVTVMGHVDHGKTSLLDYIRKTKVTTGEAGGITQHIGAYHVTTDQGVITFLDTPGHAAFTSMRARGAQATDIVILVVAADDGVMPQTIEAIQHARAADVPLIVAVNKMDKPEADPDRVRNELSQHEVISEEWGGDTIFKGVSALTGDGIDELLEAVSLQAELLELKAPALGRAQGTVIEATLDRGRGPVATVLVQAGLLSRGDIVVCGTAYGRVRALFNEAGEQVESAGPSIPVQILGLSGTPGAGDPMQAAADDRDARELVDLRRERERNLRLAERKPASMEDIFSMVKSGETPTLNVLIKTDVQGSFEALRDALEKLSTEEVNIRVVGGGVGGINGTDASLAAASKALLIGFNVRADASARDVIQEQGIELNYYSVIYEAIDMVRQVGSGLLKPDVQEQIIGLAEVKDVFRSPKFGQAAGCIVVDGVVRRNEPIRVLRDNIVIFEGELESLRRFKDDVNEVRMGTECGIAVKNYEVKAGDQIEVFVRKSVARTL